MREGLPCSLALGVSWTQNLRPAEASGGFRSGAELPLAIRKHAEDISQSQPPFWQQ